MDGYHYIDTKGSFRLENPELFTCLYFPIANENGVMGCVTPDLGGDNKMGQNTFLLEPVSSENLHNNKSSRNFWCCVKGRGLWSATGRSSTQQARVFEDGKEPTVLEAGILWHRLTRSSPEYGLSSEILSFVPCTGEKLEIMMVTLKNISPEVLEITPTAAIPLYARSADNIRDHRHVTSLLHRIHATCSGVLVNPTLTFDERGHRLNRVVYGVFGFTGNGEMPVGFFPSVKDFIGEGGSYENPKALACPETPMVPAETFLEGCEAMGGLRFSSVLLKPGEIKTYVILMGYGSSENELQASASRFNGQKPCLDALEQTKRYWNEKINVSYATGCKEFDNWMHWVHFQPMLRRIYGCSFLPHHDYGKGGRGWRDLWQDCLSLLIMDPGGVRQMLLDNFGGIRMDGTNATIIGTQPGEFIADRNNITRVWMDHGMWPFLTVWRYIMQSGDLDILLRNVSYFKDPQAVRGEEKDGEWSTLEGNKVKTLTGDDYEGSVLEHLLLEHLTAFYDVGENNQIRLRGADWNDALDLAGERGECVAFTAMYGGNLKMLAKLILRLEKQGITSILLAQEMEALLADRPELYESPEEKRRLLKNYCVACRHRISGKKTAVSAEKLAENLQNKSAWIRNHIRKEEWISDGNGYFWFNGYYDNSGRRVEGPNPLGTRMMLTSQVFAIMSGVASDAQIPAIVKSADHYLYDEDLGGYRLNTDFREVKMDLGRMFGFAYGEKENGSFFCHMAVMFANSLYQRGFVREGYKAIASLFRHCDNFEKSHIYPGIPEYIGCGGRGRYHYLTGAASWLMLTVLTEMFGVKGVYGDLYLEPKLLKEQFDKNNTASVQLIFAGRKLEILYQNKKSKDWDSYRIATLTMDGVPYAGRPEANSILRRDIQALDAVKSHQITVELE